MNDETKQYFDEDPSVESKPFNFDVKINGEEFEFKTDRGVFSYKDLDKATEILLKEFDENYVGIPKLVVDVGCGYGPIATYVAKKFEDANVIGVDPNERARKLSIENFKKNVGKDFDVYSPSELDLEDYFDLIISNPPIRIGKTALYDLLKFWAQKLKEDGQMWLVMAKHLGADSCAKFLEQECKLTVTRIASKKGFRVLKCTK